MATCPFCDSQSESVLIPGTPAYTMTCDKCGKYKYSEMLLRTLRERQDWPDLKERLSKAIPWATARGEEVNLDHWETVSKLISRFGEAEKSQRRATPPSGSTYP